MGDGRLKNTTDDGQLASGRPAYSPEDNSFFEKQHAIDTRLLAPGLMSAGRLTRAFSRRRKGGSQGRTTAESRELLKGRYNGLSTAPTIIGGANQTAGETTDPRTSRPGEP